MTYKSEVLDVAVMLRDEAWRALVEARKEFRAASSKRNKAQIAMYKADAKYRNLLADIIKIKLALKLGKKAGEDK